VKKVELLVTSFKGDVYIDELESEMEEGEAGDHNEDGEAAVKWPRQHHRLQEQPIQDEFCALHAQNATLQCEIEVLKAQLEQMSN